MQALVRDMKDHVVIFQRVSRNFCTVSNFTEARIPMEAIRGTEGLRKCMKIIDLLHMEKVLENIPEGVRDFLDKCTPWPERNKKHYEMKVLVDLAQSVLVPLFGEVTFESKYRKEVEGILGMRAEALGIGTYNTLHGTPDIRVDGLQLVFTPESPEDPQDDDESSGLGISQ